MQQVRRSKFAFWCSECVWVFSILGTFVQWCLVVYKTKRCLFHYTYREESLNELPSCNGPDKTTKDPLFWCLDEFPITFHQEISNKILSQQESGYLINMTISTISVRVSVRHEPSSWIQEMLQTKVVIHASEIKNPPLCRFPPDSPGHPKIVT